MTVLPDWEIIKRCQISSNNKWSEPLIHPFDDDLLQPASYDVRLADKVLVPDNLSFDIVDTRDPANPDIYKEVVMGNNGHVLLPGQFVLGSTQEWTNIHTDLVGRIEGKSSRARQGIQIHSAGYLDPGFCGNVTLEIVNFSPHSIRLHTDVLIAQLSFEKLSGPCRHPYSSERNHYQNSKGVVGSRYGLDT